MEVLEVMATERPNLATTQRENISASNYPSIFSKRARLHDNLFVYLYTNSLVCLLLYELDMAKVLGCQKLTRAQNSTCSIRCGCRYKLPKFTSDSYNVCK